MIRRIFPMPVHSLLLWLVWLLLNDFSAGHIVLGGLLAWGIALVASPFTSAQTKVVRPLLIPVYFAVLLWDILISNLDVARRVMGPNRSLRPGFVALPLDITGDFPQTALASTISLTPGTVSVDLSSDRRWLYIHVLHLDDEAELIASIKQGYERRLREIFAC
ncbi:monovalent cation/H+ antiporter subunit E [Bacterioplanes sanyensis]|uniref:Na+/H+ antiporter subunit E n=1 Tax=Bacterioplanes sanyensis TaxID=1249553 RepID=UPI001671E53B|nr:Na+/H+ antiporter subunit E [Bacterioplanes sanyensis]GGY36166.1 monovalent cation/H+ antiporter subunit E [Bacterioplanes sanyensis]